MEKQIRKTANNIMKKILSFALCLGLVLGTVPIGMLLLPLEVEAATFEDINQQNVFVKQQTNYTCTLASAVMMMRRTSMMAGGNWSSITEADARGTAWQEGSGLYFNFSYKGVTVSSTTLPGGSSNKASLISWLADHPEGIVVYDWNHAVLLTDYTDGVFYCADPAGGSQGRVPLTSSTISGSGQDGKIAAFKRIWYVTSPQVSLTNPVQPSKPTIQWPVVNADSVTFTWNVCKNTDDYDLYIFNHSGEIYKTIFDINSTQYTISGSEIPDGSYFAAVAATHNSSGNYTFSDQKAFYVTNTRRIFLESANGASYQPKIKIAVNDVNTDRGVKQTIIYTSDYRKATNTNYWGRELAVDKTGKVVATREYQDPNGLAIPDGGFVISMTADVDYVYQISIGDYAAFNRATRTLYVYADKSQYKLLTKTINREALIGELPQLALDGMKFNGWKMNGEFIDVNTTKLAADAVLQADWVEEEMSGDVDGDGKTTAGDALCILKNIAGLMEFDVTQKRAADTTGDGRISAEDALLVLKLIAGLVTE